MKIYACPKCGSKNICTGTMGSGVTFGITSWIEMCRDCGYQGQPIIFDSEEDYNKFLVEVKQKAIKKDINTQEKICIEDEVDEVINTAQKDKEIVELLEQYSTEKMPKPIWSKKKVWWPEIGLSLLLAALLYFSGLPNITSNMNFEIVIFYSILYFIASFVIVLFTIVVIEYFLRYAITVIRK